MAKDEFAELLAMMPEHIQNQVDDLLDCFYEYHKSMLGARSCLIAAHSVIHNTDLPIDIPTHLNDLSAKTIDSDIKAFLAEIQKEKLSWQ